MKDMDQDHNKRKLTDGELNHVAGGHNPLFTGDAAEEILWRAYQTKDCMFCGGSQCITIDCDEFDSKKMHCSKCKRIYFWKRSGGATIY